MLISRLLCTCMNILHIPSAFLFPTPGPDVSLIPFKTSSILSLIRFKFGQNYCYAVFDLFFQTLFTGFWKVSFEDTGRRMAFHLVSKSRRREISGRLLGSASRGWHFPLSGREKSEYKGPASAQFQFSLRNDTEFENWEHDWTKCFLWLKPLPSSSTTYSSIASPSPWLKQSGHDEGATTLIFVIDTAVKRGQDGLAGVGFVAADHHYADHHHHHH